MNECAISAARDDVGMITPEIIETVYQRIVVGKSDTIFSQERRSSWRITAGHAIVGAFHPNTTCSARFPSSARGHGWCHVLHRRDMDIKPKTYYIAQLRVMLGGRAAEEVVYGKA